MHSSELTRCVRSKLQDESWRGEKGHKNDDFCIKAISQGGLVRTLTAHISAVRTRFENLRKKALDTYSKFMLLNFRVHLLRVRSSGRGPCKWSGGPGATEKAFQPKRLDWKTEGSSSYIISSGARCATPYHA